jgi:hypothetical protein
MRSHPDEEHLSSSNRIVQERVFAGTPAKEGIGHKSMEEVIRYDCIAEPQVVFGKKGTNITKNNEGAIQ